MLIQQERAPVQTNAQQLDGFRISNLRKLFKTFSNIYSDPLAAVVRELICNAIDAAPGKPFIVALPSYTSPFLMIGDAGPGMDEAFMRDHYTAVGYSTKDESNDAIGGFGWGRLSAFAISDTYTITTQSRVYMLSKDEHGVPQIAYAGLDADASPGTSVRVPIATDKFSSLKHKVIEFLRWLPAESYILVGADKPSQDVVFETENFRLIPDWTDYTGALMGPVFYKIDQKIVGDDLPVCIVPKFGIGELDLPPSRESVSYDPKTIATIKAKYALVRDEVSALIFKTLRELPNLERLQLIEKLGKTWQLQNIVKDWREKNGFVEKPDAAYQDYVWGKYVERKLERVPIPVHTRFYERYRSRSHGYVIKKQPRVYSTLAFNAPPQGVFFWADVDDRVLPRITNNLSPQNVYVLFPTEEVPTIEAFQRYLPVPVRLLSELEPPARLPTVKNPPKVYDLGMRDVGYLPDDALWIDLDAPEPGRTFDQEIYRLSKSAQRAYLNETHQRFSDWVAERKAEVLAHPALKTYLGAKQMEVPTRWVRFLEDRPDAFPTLTEELRRWRNDQRFELAKFLCLIDTSTIRVPKYRNKLPALVERLIKRKPALDAYLRGRFDREFDNNDYNHFLTTRN